MNRRIECRSEGCNYEVVFKTADGAFDERRASGRIPLSPPHRHSNAIQVSPYCKLRMLCLIPYIGSPRILTYW